MKYYKELQLEVGFSCNSKAFLFLQKVLREVKMTTNAKNPVRVSYWDEPCFVLG